MTLSVDILASKQVAFQSALDITSNNVALQGTPGVQEERVLFKSFLGHRDNNDRPNYVNDITSYRDRTMGKPIQTDNPYHVAIQNDRGYFQVQTADGARYTRAGTFTRSVDGLLVDPFGNPVLSAEGAEIAIPEGSTIQISGNGTISNEEGEIGAIGVVEFENPYEVFADGDNLFTTEQAPIALGAETQVRQGAYNDGNGNSIKNLTTIIETTRGYAQTQEMIKHQIQLQTRKTDALVTVPSAA